MRIRLPTKYEYEIAAEVELNKLTVIYEENGREVSQDLADFFENILLRLERLERVVMP